MKTSLLILLLCSAFSMQAFAESTFSDESVNNVFAVPTVAGRSAITHALKGKYAATSPSRETHLMQVRQKMEDEILGVGAYTGNGDTPPIEFISAAGVNEKYIFHTIGNGPTQSIIKVSSLQKGTRSGEGFLNGTLMLPASGHTGAVLALQYAAQDTYRITYSISNDQDGKQFGLAQNILVKDAKSLGLVTLHEMSIPVVKNRVTRIFYTRSGSGGPGGYFDGRVIDFIPTDVSL